MLEYSRNKIKYLNARNNYWRRIRASRKGNEMTRKLETWRKNEAQEKHM